MIKFNHLNFQNPEILNHHGKATLFKDTLKIDVEFNYYLINERGVLICKSEEVLPIVHKFTVVNSQWRIDGINQHNQSFFSTKLILTKHDGNNHFEFELGNDIIIGKPVKSETTDSAKYRVLNLFVKDFEFEYSGFKVIVKSESTYEQELIAKYWQIPQFGASITLIKENEANESYDILINSILMLLSLSLGKFLSIPVREFVSNGHSTTWLGTARPTHRKIQSIIPEDSVCQFLKTTLPYFETDFDSRYKEMRTLLEYINSTDVGYIDDRVLSIIQVYEIVAKKWGEKYELPNKLKELKAIIKREVNQWHKSNSEFDKTIISQRLSDSLAWQKTTETLKSVLCRLEFNEEELKVDFESLVKWRHKVAHEGMIRSVDNNEVADKLLDAQFAIRLLLLKQLGYEGRVLPNQGRDKGKTMTDYFLK